jgi:hypothetical protein
MSIMLIMSCYTGFFNVRRGWQSLNTGPRFYLRLIRRTGWLCIYTSSTTDGRPFKPKKLSVPFLYPGVRCVLKVAYLQFYFYFFYFFLINLRINYLRMKTHFSDCMCILKQMFWTQWKTVPVFYIFVIVCWKIIALSEVVFYAGPMRVDTSVRGPESQEGACEGPIALAIEVLFYISGFIGPKILNFKRSPSLFPGPQISLVPPCKISLGWPGSTWWYIHI